MLNKCSSVIKLTKEEVYPYLTDLWGLDMSKIKIIGITGTNGKTTVSYLVQQILNECNIKNRLIGTINSNLTTPEMFDLLENIKDMQAKNETHLIMEVSSIGITEKRIHGLTFAVKCLTNITQDHLDYHKTFKHYVESKFKFLNLPGPTVFPKDYKRIPINFPTQLKGKFNLFNIQAAYAIALALNISKPTIEKALEHAIPPKGRFQYIKTSNPFNIIVDYAHTPDGLTNILKEARRLTDKNLIVVFGAGGDRDKLKRPLMGKAADDLADIIVLTSDNPRSEVPEEIMKDIQAGISRSDMLTITDREEAIRKALQIAKRGDTIVIAGKGHENYQILHDKTIHFDDVEIVMKYSK
ncbi:MAG: hypothetical protein A2Y40_00835 [Candidatus Margulisbacteria bacterium GWF2_35_9]|nr:MAG: hypothetical protein A2Y40_00835 [Candidatus Margulisbacteria bacterium GWF2_35_9]